MSDSVQKGKERSQLSPIFKDHRGPVFYLVALVFILFALIQTFILQGAVPGMTEARWGGLAAFIMFVGITSFYRITGNLRIASALLLAAAYAGLTYSALKQGGAPAPTLAYAPFLPIVATVLLGRAAGAASVCISIAAIAFCTYAANAGLATPSPHTPSEFRILLASAAILLSLGVTVYAFIYENLILKAVKETEKAKVELEEKAAALEESREFLSTVMDAAHDAIIAADASGKLSVFNRAARNLHGIDAQPLDSQDWPSTYSLFESDGKTPMTFEKVPLFRAIHGETVSGREMAIAVPGCDIRYTVANAKPLYNSQKKLIGAVATMRDVTTERQQQDEIRAQNREIDKFARVASLDLQGPLNRIIMTSEALANSPEVRASAKTRTDLAAVAAAAKKMGALIKDVLYMSRLPIGEMSLQPVAVRDCIEAAIDLAGLSEVDCRLDFRFTGSPEVLADPQSLTHVFKNLIENAWKHANPDVKAHAEFTCIAEDGAAILGVKDNGPGMSQDQIDRLFTPLERIRTDGDDGTGLGLAICRKSLTRMGGDFWVESQPGQGCHFRMRLPLAHRETAAAS
ncbi:sensor histidine kinase [Hyphococcus sp.]|uniref:sensor histidine kinase n=1 Tax=Hyphococcus sp. TaxID=2038636 RepID=UPI003D0B8E1E